jgi:serine/threonine protein kinase
VLGDQGFGRYELVERLAVRPASELFVVKVSGEHGFRRDIVLKRLRDDALAGAFIEDAKLSAKLSHAKIVQTLELGRLGEVPYVAMEYVDGIDLLGLLRALARTRRRLEPTLAAWIAQELLDALDYAHTFVDDDGRRLEIVHGHLSPTKILLGEQGEVKMTDFGVTRHFNLVECTGQDFDFGHLSPEQVMELPHDARSDVFGVGVLLAEMLMRKRLFAAHNEFDVLLMVRDVRISRLDLSGVDPALVGIVQHALEKRPEDRYQTAAAFRDALDEWLFAKRALNMNQQLAALVGEVRDETDAWRRSGERTTPELDDLRDPTGPVTTMWARGSVAPPNTSSIRRTIEIPPRALAKGSDAPLPAEKPQLGAHPRLVPRKTPSLADLTAFPSGNAASPGHARLVGIEEVLPQRTPTERREQLALSSEELRRAGQPTPPPLATLEPAPDDNGDFTRTSPLRVLFHLMRTRATGLLAVTINDVVRKDIYIRDGQLAGVWSSDANDLFGNYLVAQRILSDGELSMALAMVSHYGGKIGDTLVGLGLLGRVEVFRHLTRHARTKVVDLCSSTAGRYAWYAGKEDPRESFPLEPEAFSMLGEAALALRPDIIDAWLATKRNEQLTTVKTQRVSPDVFGIPLALSLYAKIDSARSIGALVDAATDRARAARTLYLFIACELARLL